MRTPTFLSALLLVVAAGCQMKSASVDPGTGDELPLSAVPRTDDSSLGNPDGPAPEIDPTKVVAQVNDSALRTALVVGRPGAAAVASGVTEVCVQNRTTLASPVCQTPIGADGSFSLIVPGTLEGDVVSVYTNGPAYLPGSPEINGVEKRVVHLGAPFASRVVSVRSTSTDLWVGAEDGLYVHPFKADGLGAARHLTIAHGLPRNAVRSVAVDGDEGVWLATAAGLTRVDLTAREPVVESWSEISGRSVAGLLEVVDGGFEILSAVSSGRHWMIPEDAQPVLWARTDFDVFRIVLVDGRPTAIDRLSDILPPSGPITALIGDRFGRGWAGSDQQGVLRLDPGIGGFSVTFYGVGEGLSGNCVEAMALSNDRLWVATSQGLDLLDVSTTPRRLKSVARPREIGFNTVTAMALSADATRLYVLTGTGLRVFAVSDAGIGALLVETSDTEARGSAIAVDAAGRIWFATRDGFASLSLGASGLDVRSFESRNSTAGLSDGDVRQLELGPDGTIWAVTGDGILNRIESPLTWAPRFGKIAVGNPADPIPILSIFWSDAVLLGTEGAGVATLDPAAAADGSIAEEASIAEVPLGEEGTSGPLPGYSAHDIAPDGAGGFFVAAGEVRHLRSGLDPSAAVSYRLPNGDVFDLAADGTGGFWAAPLKLEMLVEGVTHLIGQSLDHVTFDADGAIGVRSFGTADGLATTNLTRIVPDGQGGFWIGMRGAGMPGLSHMTVAPDGTPSFRHFALPRPEGTKDIRVLSLAVDPRGGVLVGTAHRLIHLTFAPDGTERFRVFTRADGLPSEYVSAVAVAPDGAFVIGTDAGIAILVNPLAP
jgi:ligand-binding sensor domain-containing protein